MRTDWIILFQNNLIGIIHSINANLEFIIPEEIPVYLNLRRIDTGITYPGQSKFHALLLSKHGPLSKFFVRWIRDIDGSFPESVRLLKLEGAQLVCLITNWPEEAEVSARFSPILRSQENHVNFMSCNRVGEEGGVVFRGESKVCDFNGKILAEAAREAEVVRAEVDMAGADKNHVVYKPGKYELDRIRDRRPDFYGRITRP